MVWLYIPSSCVPVSECSGKGLEPDSSFLDSSTEPFATWSGKPLLPRNLSRLWRRESLIRHLSGLTCSPSTAQRGAGRWISSLPDSLARIFPSLAEEQGLTEKGLGCSFVSSTLQTIAVRQGSFWRTSVASLLPPPPLWTRKKASSKKERPPASWENWPTAGGLRNGSLFQRPTWEPVTSESAGSVSLGESWPTPVANDDNKTPAAHMAMKRRMKGGSRNTITSLNVKVQTKNWATPDCNTSTYSNGLFGQNLREQAKHWPSPRATDGTNGGPNQRGSKGDLMLPSAAAHWPTPNAHDGRRPGADLKSTQGGNLSRDAVVWPTPAARDSKGANSAEHALVTGGGRKHMDQLANFVEHSPSSPLAQPTSDGLKSYGSEPILRRRLNPAFGCWLMGWPCWWTNPGVTSSVRSEMASYRCALQQHLSSLLGER